MKEDYLEINRASWNNRLETHLNSAFYDVAGFISGQTSLNPIELELLGDLRGKSILHLQCHFGQDTLSLARLGAEVVGVDLSDKAIESAEELAEKTGLSATFVCCNIYDLPLHLDRTFDIVFTSYGTITWLPDLSRWAELIARYLKPGGRFVFAEFHPVVWMFDLDFKKIEYSYFNRGPISETEEGTYADKTAQISQSYVTWNHSLGEVVGSLLHASLQVEGFKEYDYSPYNIFPNVIEISPKKFQLKNLEAKLPLVYSLVAHKPR
jgi:SAM-dependent methyltransferase